MDGTAWDRLVERLRRSRGRRALLAGLAGASLLGGASTAPHAAARKRKKKKVAICRNGQTLSVTKKRKQKHLRPGDTPGKCQPPVCQGVKPADDLQAAIEAAASGSTLTLCPGTFRISATLTVEKDLTLAGAGVNETILDGEAQVRVLAIGPFERSPTVTVQDLTITRGLAAGGLGGGIINKGNLTLQRMAVTNCKAFFGGGVGCPFGSTLTMNVDSIVEHNTATDGGGIHNAGMVTMNDGSSVRLNEATRNGGGISIELGSLIMHAGSSVVENTAGAIGGGIYRTDSGTFSPGGTVANNTPTDCEAQSGACA